MTNTLNPYGLYSLMGGQNYTMPSSLTPNSLYSTPMGGGMDAASMGANIGTSAAMSGGNPYVMAAMVAAQAIPSLLGGGDSGQGPSIGFPPSGTAVLAGEKQPFQGSIYDLFNRPTPQYRSSLADYLLR